MSENRVTVLYLGSKFIEGYINKHPIRWAKKSLSERGGIGDQAGMPPTPMVYEFFSFAALRQGLFTQNEYCEHCFQQWSTWNALNDPLTKAGIQAKLSRNVYPSMINTLHAWALLVEAGWFDICVIDSAIDAYSKHDLIIYRKQGNQEALPVALDLFIGSRQSLTDRQYKLSHRKSLRDFVCESVEVPLPMARPQKQPSNMRWYCLKDFERVYTLIRQDNSLWSTPTVPCTCGYHNKGKGIA